MKRNVICVFLLFIITARLFSEDATFAWDPNPEDNIAGYRLYYWSAMDNYTNVLECGNVTRKTVSGLEIGKTYSFYLTCHNVLGLESEPSNIVIYKVPVTGVTNFPPIIL